jgi:RIO kinase 1
MFATQTTNDSCFQSQTNTTTQDQFSTAEDPTQEENLELNYEDDDEDDDYEDDIYGEIEEDNFPADAGPNSSLKRIQPMSNVASLERFAKKINLGVLRVDDPTQNLPSEVSNAVKEHIRKDNANRIRLTEKADRATTEQVLDPRTRMILFKLLNRRIIDEIHGCVSTGKEANVYHATNESGEEMAIKVYKTSILIFKDRDRYVSGEFRFRKGYARHNPRKMVRLWAEKEMRNLLRLTQAGIPCPKPILLRQHVLVMSFIGKQGWAAPRLKDAKLDVDKLTECYYQIVRYMRRMFHTCRLVHADLSEYNILYFKGTCYIIDVGQAVEHDHPHALEFLRIDCYNITNFFRKEGVLTLRTKELFDFVTDISITPATEDAYLAQMQEKIKNRSNDPSSATEDDIDEEFFKKVFIPRTLNEVVDFEEDIEKGQKGEEELLYQKLTGVKLISDENKIKEQKKVQPSPAQTQTPSTVENKDQITGSKEDKTQPQYSDDNESDEDGESSSEEEDTSQEDSDQDKDQSKTKNDQEAKRPPKKRTLKKDEDKETKKARKNAMKEQKREKRKTKIPKHVKKRRQQLARKSNKANK